MSESVSKADFSQKLGKVIPQEEADGLNQVSSLREYAATPFQNSDWEVIGDPVIYGDFSPLDVVVLQGEELVSDPMFEDFSDSISKGREHLFHTPNGEFVDSSKKSQEFDEELIAERVEQAFAKGKEAGFAEGQEQAKLEIATQYEKLSNRLNEHLLHVAQEIRAHQARLEEQAFQLALGVARKLLALTAEAKPDYILDVIRQGLRNLGAAHAIRIRVSTDDMEFLEIIGVPPELSAAELGVEYVIDESIKSGCIIETNFGEVDLQLDSMWEQVKADLFEVTK